MYALISHHNTQMPAGSVMRMPATWQDYCIVRDSRGDASIPRLKYHDGELVLMSPMPRHGREANLLADIVKVLLDRQNRNYEAFTPITMELPEIRGIEPDYCFYIENWAAVSGKDRIDWQVDPPPDLAIEIDVTSYTDIADYLPYQIPEVWLFKKQGLQIYRWQNEAYLRQTSSPHFPSMNLDLMIAEVMQVAAERGMGVAIRELRQSLYP